MKKIEEISTKRTYHCVALEDRGERIVAGNVNYGIGMINVNILRDKP